MASRVTAMTNEAIALTEKKMDMTLDEIIKMSSKSSSKARNPRASNKSGGFLKGSAPQRNAARAQQFIDSRSSIRQGVLAQRRSNFRGNQFPVATEVARKAAVAPIHNNAFTRKRALNWKKPRVAPPRVQREVATESAVDGRMRVTPKQRRPQTLDSLFANMKEQRMRAIARQQKQGSNNQRNARPRQFQGRGAQVPQWGRGGRGASNAAAAFGNRYSK